MIYLDILKYKVPSNIPYEEDIINTTYFVTFMLLLWRWVPLGSQRWCETW